MFLYENNGQFIDVYELEPKLEEITEYKKSEMEKISEKYRVWRAFTNHYDFKTFEKHDDLVLRSQLKYIKKRESSLVCYHEFARNYNIEMCSQILDEYYNGIDFNFCKVVGDYRTDGYFILLYPSYTKLGMFVMDGIIKVPESLYLLQALLNKRFDLIGDKDITEQLMLFDIQHIGRINTGVLKNICEYQLLTDSYESIIGRTNVNKDVVSKVKKLAR